MGSGSLRTDDDVGQAGLTRTSSVGAAVRAFHTYMSQQGFSENTVRAFLSDLRILSAYVGAGTAIGAVSTRDLVSFTDWLVVDRGVPCGPKSLARRVTCLKVFFGWLAESNAVSEDAAAALVHRPVSSALPTVLSDGEVERVLEVCRAMRRRANPDARPHLLVSLLLHTGIKKGECMRMVLNHFDLSDLAKPVLWVRYAHPRRRHKERKIALPIWLPAVLGEYQAQHKVQSVLFPCTARNLEYVLAGIGDEAELSRKLSFEMLRWTCAVRDHANMPAERVRQKLGITTITWRDVQKRIARLASQRSRADTGPTAG